MTQASKDGLRIYVIIRVLDCRHRGRPKIPTRAEKVEDSADLLNLVNTIERVKTAKMRILNRPTQWYPWLPDFQETLLRVLAPIIAYRSQHQLLLSPTFS